MTFFCDLCGHRSLKGSIFCDTCGALQGQRIADMSGTTLNKHIVWFVALALTVLVIAISVIAQGKFGSTQRALRDLEQKTADTLAAQGKILGEQDQKLSAQGEALAQSKATEAFLRGELNRVSTTRVATSSNSSLVSEISFSIVKLICVSAAYSDSYQQGSGTLYQSAGSYFVRTNLHVVRTEDGSTSSCVIVVYPKPGDSSNFVFFESSGYQYYQHGVDIAVIYPTLVSGHAKAGTTSDLARYAREESLSPVCSTLYIGDHLVVLGYPGVGGDTLTVTDGIVAGFEDQYGIRLVKTSAKIEHGNSGGLALLDSGCVIGIPTFVQTGQIESIGRILDLNSVKYLSLRW